MKNLRSLSCVAFVGCLTALTFGAAAPGEPSATYEVTVTNLTRNQVFSPLLAATHRAPGAMFTPGLPASDELALLAEEGDNSALMTALLRRGDIGDIQSGEGGILPGHSDTLTLTTFGSNRVLSLASMLVNTNDAFVGLESVRLPKRSSSQFAIAFDAGSEFNSESCAYVPGPACGSSMAHDPRDAEGSVYVSNGIHGIGDLPSDSYDWRNPVAYVTIRRVQ